MAAASAGAAPVLTQVGEILKSLPNAIRVEVDADNRPISTSLFSSSRQLSAARAANVLQLIIQAAATRCT